MNLAYFLTPKQDVTTLFDDNTYRKGLEILRKSGQSTLPVTTREGVYVGVVTAGDFLWRIVNGDVDKKGNLVVTPSEGVMVKDIMKDKNYPPVNITASLDDLLSVISNQNFVPVVDARGVLIGIVRRHTVLDHLAQEMKKNRQGT